MRNNKDIHISRVDNLRWKSWRIDFRELISIYQRWVYAQYNGKAYTFLQEIAMYDEPPHKILSKRYKSAHVTKTLEEIKTTDLSVSESDVERWLTIMGVIEDEDWEYEELT